MSSNHTEHYHLSQWLPDDKVLRADFNEDNRVIDETLAAQAAALAKKADAGAVTSQAEELSKKANAADLQALASRLTTRNCRMMATGYSGNGSATRKLTFNGMPYFVFIMGYAHWLSAVDGSPKAQCGSVLGNGGELVNITWGADWITLTSPSSDPTMICNWSGHNYYVLALIEAT